MNCPKCGKQISKGVVSCPHCKYDIQDYLENREQVRQSEAAQRQKRPQPEKPQTQTNIETATADVKCEISAIKKMRLVVILIGVALLLLAVVCVGYIQNEFLAETLFMLLGLASIGTFIFAATSVSAIRKCEDKLKLIQTDFNAYLAQQEAETRARNDKYREEINLAHPKCPCCGSTNTRRIGNINRATSVAVWGLASSKIGKQYECQSCNHKW